MSDRHTPKDFRFYYLNKDGRIVGVETIDCTLADVPKLCLEVLNSQPDIDACEVWHRHEKHHYCRREAEKAA